MNEEQIFKALSDQTRLRIMILLLDENELCVCGLMKVLNLPQSTISRHLSYLKNSNLIIDNRKGVWNYYSIVKNKSIFFSHIIKSLKQCSLESTIYKDDNKKLKEYLKTKNNNC